VTGLSTSPSIGNDQVAASMRGVLNAMSTR
jgi:hypothetical protein